METFRVQEEDLKKHDKRLPDTSLFYFKIVSVGPNMLKDNDYQPKVICDIVNQQNGYFMFGSSFSEMRKALHDVLDMFVDKLEETQNESKTKKK
jgi:hypothetical protein